MQPLENNIQLKETMTEPSDEAFEDIIKKLVSYGEALKCSLTQIK